MKKNITYIIIFIFSMLMENACFAQTLSNIPLNDITLGNLTLGATLINTLPAWYIEAQDNVIPDLEKRYHRSSSNQTRYLKVDSFDHNNNLMIETTKEKLQLFFEAYSGEKTLVATCNKGISSVEWSYDNQYFYYQEVTEANDDFILSSLHIVRVENDKLTDHITLMENLSSIDPCWDLFSEKLAFADFHRLFIFYMEENKLFEIKPIWTDNPEGYPQLLDKLAFSPDSNYLIFRYRPSYWGDRSEYYQVIFP